MTTNPTPLHIPRPPVVAKMRRKSSYDVMQGDQCIGMVNGDYAMGFVAYDRKGNRLGSYGGRTCKEDAVQAVRAAMEVEHITAALGATIISVDIDNAVTDVTAHVA